MLSSSDWLLVPCSHDNRIILLLKLYCYYGNVYVIDSIIIMLSISVFI